MNKNFIDLALGFKRLDAEPLEANRLFSSYESAVAFASSDPTVYPGLTLVVANPDTQEIQQYIVGYDKSLTITGKAVVHKIQVSDPGSKSLTKKIAKTSYPQFEVLSVEGDIIEVKKSYVDPETVKISWNGELHGYLVIYE